MPKPPVVCAAAAVAVLAAGCGGSSRLSHDELVQRANAICTSYNTAIRKLRRPRTPTQVEIYTKRVLPLYRRALRELAMLEPSRDDAPAVARLLRADRKIETDLVQLAAAAHDRRIPRLQAVVARARVDNAASNRVARSLGLTVCANA